MGNGSHVRAANGIIIASNDGPASSNPGFRIAGAGCAILSEKEFQLHL